MKKSFRTSGIFWGIVLILAALLMIADAIGSSLGIIDLPLLKIAVSCVLLVWAVCEAVKGKPGHIFFPAAFIFILFRSDIAKHFGLEEDFISVWTVLLCALLFQIGVSLIFRRKKKNVFPVQSGEACENNIGSGVCYIDASELGYQKIENNMGEMNVYIENAETYSGDGTIEIENNLGTTKVHIPTAWRTDVQAECALGAINDRTCHSGDGPVIRVCGECNVGSIELVNV